MTHGALTSHCSDEALTSHCSDEADRREPGKCRWIANLHQLHGWGRSVSQIVELPHVEHVGKSRFSILGRLGLAYRFICARRRWRCPRRRLGYNGTLKRISTKRRGSNWHAANVDRPERDRKRFQGSTDSAAAHIRPDGSAIQVIADSRVANPTTKTRRGEPAGCLADGFMPKKASQAGILLHDAILRNAIRYPRQGSGRS